MAACITKKAFPSLAQRTKLFVISYKRIVILTYSPNYITLWPCKVIRLRKLEFEHFQSISYREYFHFNYYQSPTHAMHGNSYWMSFRGEKVIIFELECKQKCMKLLLKKKDIERNNTKFISQVEENNVVLFISFFFVGRNKRQYVAHMGIYNIYIHTHTKRCLLKGHNLSYCVYIYIYIYIKDAY